jgi:hypothetical protein
VISHIKLSYNLVVVSNLSQNNSSPGSLIFVFVFMLLNNPAKISQNQPQDRSLHKHCFSYTTKTTKNRCIIQLGKLSFSLKKKKKAQQ